MCENFLPSVTLLLLTYLRFDSEEKDSEVAVPAIASSIFPSPYSESQYRSTSRYINILQDSFGRVCEVLMQAGDFRRELAVSKMIHRGGTEDTENFGQISPWPDVSGMVLVSSGGLSQKARNVPGPPIHRILLWASFVPFCCYT